MTLKNAIITGAAGNLGRAISTVFINSGCQVHAIISHTDDASQINRKGLSAYRADLAAETETSSVLKGIFNKTENIDSVIMTVGGYAPGSLQEVSAMDIEKMLRLNFLTAFNVAISVIPVMEKQKTPGRLIFIGARPGLHPEQGISMVAYTLSKSLIFRLSEIINQTYKGKNIRSFVVVPGIIDTPQNRAAMPDADFSKWVKPDVIAEQILKITESPDIEIPGNILEIYSNS